MEYSIEAVSRFNVSSMIEFLKEREDYTLFLMSNYEQYGLHINEAPYSGNYRLIRSKGGEVAGVFCLTKIGNLLIESSAKEPLFSQVLASCQKEQIPLKGVIGRWGLCKALWDFLKKERVIERETYAEKQILYSLDLLKTAFEQEAKVRFLKEEDFEQWLPLRLDDLKASGIHNDLSEDEHFSLFSGKAKGRIIWGYFEGNRLASIAELNATAQGLGQVGGVYTAPDFRRRGYSKAVMRSLAEDCKHIHSLKKLIIFTGEDNLSANLLYQSLGVSPIGNFALLFGEASVLGNSER